MLHKPTWIFPTMLVTHRGTFTCLVHNPHTTQSIPHAHKHAPIHCSYGPQLVPATSYLSSRWPHCRQAPHSVTFLLLHHHGGEWPQHRVAVLTEGRVTSKASLTWPLKMSQAAHCQALSSLTQPLSSAPSSHLLPCKDLPRSSFGSACLCPSTTTCWF